MEAIKCPGCGRELTEQSNFCTYCGYDLRNSNYSSGNAAYFTPKQPHTEIPKTTMGSLPYATITNSGNVTLKIIGVLFLIIGIYYVPYIFRNISNWFTFITYGGFFSLTTFRIFLYILENLVAAVGFIAAAVVLVAAKPIGYLRISLLPVLIHFVLRILTYLVLCIEWFHVHNLLYMILSLVLLAVWAAVLFPEAAGNLLPAGSQKVILTAIVAVVFLISLILSRNYLYTFWTSLVNFLEHSVLIAIICFNPLRESDN